MAEVRRDWLLYPALVLGLLTWPLWGMADMVREWRFQDRFASAKDILSFDGRHIVGRDGVVPLEEVLRARAWSYTVLSMASGAEESMGLELQLRDGSLRRYAGFRLFEVVPALVAAGKLAPEPENGGNSGGIGRPLMLFGWMLLVGAVILSTWRGTG